MNSIIHGEAVEPMTAEKAAKLKTEYSQSEKTEGTMQEEYDKQQVAKTTMQKAVELIKIGLDAIKSSSYDEESVTKALQIIQKAKVPVIKDGSYCVSPVPLGLILKDWFGKSGIGKLTDCYKPLQTTEDLENIKGSPSDFNNVLGEMQKLYEKKNHDYGNSFSETIQEFGFTPAIARINDKFNRVKQMVKGEQMLINESMRDNLIDIANYCILTIIEIDKSS